MAFLLKLVPLLLANHMECVPLVDLLNSPEYLNPILGTRMQWGAVMEKARKNSPKIKCGYKIVLF